MEETSSRNMQQWRQGTTSTTRQYQDDLSTFPQFVRMPVEIRLKIWEHAVADPRVVTLMLRNLKATPNQWPRRLKDGATEKWKWHDKLQALDDYPIERTLPERFPERDISSLMPAPTAEPKVPPALFACRESHHVASHYYTRTFSNTHWLPETYFNFEKDILYLRRDMFFPDPTKIRRMIGYLDYVNARELGKVKNLALMLRQIDTDMLEVNLEKFLADLLGLRFPAVQNLYLILGHYGTLTSTTYTLVDPFNDDDNHIPCLVDNPNPTQEADDKVVSDISGQEDEMIYNEHHFINWGTIRELISEMGGNGESVTLPTAETRLMIDANLPRTRKYSVIRVENSTN